MRVADPKYEFKCVHCGFPNPIEMQRCMMCHRDAAGKFYPIMFDSESMGIGYNDPTLPIEKDMAN